MTNMHAPKKDPREQYERAVAFVKRSRRFWWMVPLAMLLGGFACGVFLFLRQPDYLSETVILYTEGARPADPNAAPLLNPRNTGVRLREMLFARQRLEAIIEEFDLYPDIVEEQGVIAAVDEFREDIVYKAPGSDTFLIGYRGKSAKQAKGVTERLAESLMLEDGSLRRRQAEMTRDFLDKERSRSEKELKQRERELAEFLADNPGFALDAALLTGAPSSGAAIRAAEAETRAQRAGAPPTPGGGRSYVIVPGTAPARATPTGPDPQLVAKQQRAEAALTAARQNLIDKQARYTANHPDVRSAKANVARVEGQLKSIEDAVAASLQAAQSASPDPVPQQRVVVRRRAPAPEPKTKAERAEQQQIEKDLVALETEWSRLMRGVQESRTRHDQLEASFFKADIAASSEIGGSGIQMQVIDPAFLPGKPLPPGPLTILVAALLVSLMLGTAITAGRTVVDDRLYDARDAAVFAAVLTEVPRQDPRTLRRLSHG